MDKKLLDNVRMPKEWVLIPRNMYTQLGIYEDDESVVCLGVYGNQLYPTTSTVIYSYGTDYSEFLDNYLGLIYDNNSDKFIPKEFKDDKEINPDLTNIYSGDQTYGKHKFIVNVFRVGKQINATYSAQFFVIYKGNLLNFTTPAYKIDEDNVYSSLITKNPHIKRMIIDLFNYL